MKFTNNNGIPDVLFELITTDTYTKGDSWRSVTQLISPPQIILLRLKHDEKISIDASDRIWLLIGKAMHALAEKQEAPGRVLEQRIFSTVLGKVISGQIDIQRKDGNKVVISDYKFTSVFAAGMDKIEWEQQLNCYAYLAHKELGVDVVGLQIYAVMRDWNKRDAKGDPDYPACPIKTIHIPVWTPARRVKYVEERVRVHAAAEDADLAGQPIPECTTAERWGKPQRFAVRKSDAKRALAILDTKGAAGALCRKNPGSYVVPLPVRYTRCVDNWCQVARWCPQWKKENDVFNFEMEKAA